MGDADVEGWEGSLHFLLNFVMNLKPLRENVLFKVYVWGDITS